MNPHETFLFKNRPFFAHFATYLALCAQSDRYLAKLVEKKSIFWWLSRTVFDFFWKFFQNFWKIFKKSWKTVRESHVEKSTFFRFFTFFGPLPRKFLEKVKNLSRPRKFLTGSIYAHFLNKSSKMYFWSKTCEVKLLKRMENDDFFVIFHPFGGEFLGLFGAFSKTCEVKVQKWVKKPPKWAKPKKWSKTPKTHQKPAAVRPKKVDFLAKINFWCYEKLRFWPKFRYFVGTFWSILC